jgi:hypothetical protein
MWFGFLVMATTWLANNTNLIQGLIPDKYSEIAGYIIGLAIWVLRYVTNQPLEEKVDTKKIHPPSGKPMAGDVLEKELRAEDDYIRDF